MVEYFEPSRIDFVFETRCTDCNRLLTSSTATIMQDDSGKEFSLGPHCARKRIAPDREHLLKQIPNLTRAHIPISSDYPSINGHDGSEERPSFATREIERDCLEYVMLRQQKLSHFDQISWDVLDNVLREYNKQGQLTERSIKTVQSTISKNHGKRLGKRNLMTAYAFDILITKTLSKITKPDDKIWLTKQQDKLRKWGHLYPDTAAKVNNWLKNHLGERYALNYDGFF